MTRFQHFLRLCDLDGIVSAKTLAREAGGTVHRNAEWLRIQARTRRIERVAVGRYGRAPDGTERLPQPEAHAVRMRAAQQRLRDRRKTGGVCRDCGGESVDTRRCLACREKRAAQYKARKEERCRDTLTGTGTRPQSSAAISGSSCSSSPTASCAPATSPGC